LCDATNFTSVFGSPRCQRASAVTFTLPSEAGITFTDPLVLRMNTVVPALTGEFHENADGSTCSGPLLRLSIMQALAETVQTKRRPYAGKKVRAAFSLVQPVIVAGMSSSVTAVTQALRNYLMRVSATGCCR
jgi:hypothetical protein